MKQKTSKKTEVRQLWKHVSAKLRKCIVDYPPPEEADKAEECGKKTKPTKEKKRKKNRKWNPRAEAKDVEEEKN